MMASSKYKIVITGDGSAAVNELGKVGDASDKTSGRMAGIGKTAAVVGLAVAAGAVAAGRALYEIGETFDAAFDKIRIGTGATGETLAGLEQSFKNVFASGPAAAEDVSTAIANLNTKFGITGKTLETVSKQMLDLARITDGDATATIDGAAHALANFGIPAEAMEGVMDKLFRVTQSTGLSFDDLARQLGDNGVKLRAAGLDIDASAAFLGSLAKAGISASDVIPGLSAALKNAAKAGVPAEKMIRNTFAAIAMAPDDVHAAGEAMKLFGDKAGPQMAAAIREGKLSYDELLLSMQEGDTISGLAKETEDFAEKWETLKNKTFVALEPAATKLFNSLGTAMDRISVEYMPRFLDGMAKLERGFKVIGDTVGPWVENFKIGWANLVADWDRTVERFRDGWSKISTFFSNFKAEWDQTVAEFGRGISRIASFFADMKGNFNAGVDVIKNAVNAVVSFITGIPGRIAGIGSSIASAIGDGFKSAWNTVAGTINNTIPDKIPLPFGRSIDLPPNPLPRFHNGGRAGTEQVALLQAGEVVYTAAQNRAGMAPGGGGPSITVNINGPVGDPSEAGRQIVAVVERYLDSGGSARFAA